MIKVARRKNNKLAFEFLPSSCSNRKAVAYSLRRRLHVSPGLREVRVIYAGHIEL